MADFSAKALRQMDLAELITRKAEIQKDLFDLRVGTGTKEQSNTALIRDRKRDYARLLTILGEKETAKA